MQFSVNIYRFELVRLEKWNVHVPDRPYWRLYWNANPGAFVTANGRTLELEPARILLIPPQTHYGVGIRSPVEHFYIHFQLSKDFAPAARDVLSVPVDGVIEAVLSSAVSSVRERKRRQSLTAACLISSVCETLPDEAWSEPSRHRRLAPVMEIMESRLDETISNRDLARAARMTPAAFARLFRRDTGTSPQAYRLQKRLEHASLMLEYGDESIEQIAEATGFCDRNYFSAVFSRKMGVSPAQFRRESRGSETTRGD